MSAPPLLPWEVIERIINYSSDDTRTLHHLSLTCRQLRPRSLCLMVADIYLSSRRHVFTLCDFLQAHPHLRPLVRALTIHLHEFAPFPLLHVLPNISRLTFDSSKLRSRPRLNTLPNPILTSCRLYGTRIRDLCLSRLTFQSFQDFARLTLAFTNLQRLILLDVRSKDAKGGSSAQLELSKQRLSRHLRLRTLVMDGAVEEKVSSLLFKAVELTVETLYLEVDEGIITTHARLLSLLQTLQKSIWVQLRSLTLSVLQAESRTIKAIAAFLTEFHHPKLMNVVVHLHSDSIHDLLRVIASVEGGDARVRLDLDQALRFFNHPGIDFCLKAPVSARRTGMWIHELGKYFTSLQGGGSLRILCDRTVTTGDFDHEATCLRSWVAQHGRERPPSRSKHEISVAASHEGRVRSLVYSTDSQWMATASDDSTIILWDSEGRIVREWVGHVGGVTALAFSPDNKYLLSSGYDRKLAIWTVNNDTGVASLEGHTDQVNSCAWSPDGTRIASGSDDKTVRLWDARTFKSLCLLETEEHGHVLSMQFSPDGRWLAARGWDHRCCVWDLASRPSHKDLLGHTDNLKAIAFDPKTERLATASSDRTVRIWDVQTGEPLLVLQEDTDWVVDVAFSPDGQSIASTTSSGTVTIWDASSGAMIRAFEGHTGTGRAVCFSPCGKYVASGSDDGTVRLWRTSDGSCVKTFSGHTNWATHVAFSPDGKTLTSGGRDGNVFIRQLCDVLSPD